MMFTCGRLNVACAAPAWQGQLACDMAGWKFSPVLFQRPGRPAYFSAMCILYTARKTSALRKLLRALRNTAYRLTTAMLCSCRLSRDLQKKRIIGNN